jgi:restriction system protein
MAIPDYQTVMLPLLRFAADKQEHSTREAIEELANHFGLTEDERNELLPSGSQATFDNRVG